MPFNVATIKDKATSAKNATVTKFQDTRDRHTSAPMAKTKFANDGYAPDARKAPPPPPPARSGPSFQRTTTSPPGDDGRNNPSPRNSTQGPPPVVKRNTRPGSPLGRRERSQSPNPSRLAEHNGSNQPDRSSSPSNERSLSVLERAKAFSSAGISPAPNSLPKPKPKPKSWAPQNLSQQSQKEENTHPPFSAATDISNTTTYKSGKKSIDWTNLKTEDREMFFNWMDEYFSRRHDRIDGQAKADSASNGDINEQNRPSSPPPTPPVPSRVETVTSRAPSPRRGPPPVIKSWSKPTLPSRVSDSSTNFIPSYPPPTTHGSQGLDLAMYFHPSVHWATAWYTDKSKGGLPPLLLDNHEKTYKGQMMSHGDMHTVQIAAIFSDLSACWYKVVYSASSPLPEKERSAHYIPPPEALDGSTLVAASETYGETIASFAEGFLGSGQFCARGECWDLANEALKCFAEYDYVDKPVPSLGRTHGHLIFVGRAHGLGKQEGIWRGGDDRVRRGDIVEWKSVRIRTVGAPVGAYSILGDPEHTAVITRDAVPDEKPNDGMQLMPASLKELEVVEQSRNSPPEPKKAVYDMEGFQEGEVWIYRPISMETYLGIKDLECTPPPHAVEI